MHVLKGFFGWGGLNTEYRSSLRAALAASVGRSGG